jgi:hypothetical protein
MLFTVYAEGSAQCFPIVWREVLAEHAHEVQT